MELEVLKEQETYLIEKLSENRKLQKKINTAAFVAKHKADIGDEIEWLDGRRAMRGIITGFYFSGTAPYWHKATPFKLNGELGKIEKIIYKIGSIRVIKSKGD